MIKMLDQHEAQDLVVVLPMQVPRAEKPMVDCLKGRPGGTEMLFFPSHLLKKRRKQVNQRSAVSKSSSNNSGF